jgi:predicted peptidase
MRRNSLLPLIALIIVLVSTIAVITTSCGGSGASTTAQNPVSATTLNVAAQTSASENTATVIAGYEQFTFTDPAYKNETLMYSLYLPADYDASKKYPLVLFMSDSSEIGSDPLKALSNCYGATVWALPSEQAKHECIVVVPQYDTGQPVVNDNSEASEYLDITIDLVKSLESQYGIDTNRIYNTGQSMGGMMSIAMDIKYPDLFAASYLVACQWDATLVAPMAQDNLWIVVSEGDTKAYPGMNAITTALHAAGATVAQATWNRDASAEEFATDVSDMLAQGANVNYAVLTGGDHMSTFNLAYQIEGIRDWLFAQTKS